MANDIQRNPWVITDATTGPIWKGYIRAEALAWNNVFAAGDTLLLQDQNGKEIWSFTAPSPGYYNFGKPMWINGLTVAQISSGTVYITIN